MHTCLPLNLNTVHTCIGIVAVTNIGGPFLGVPKAVAGLFSSEAKDVAVAR